MRNIRFITLGLKRSTERQDKPISLPNKQPPSPPPPSAEPAKKIKLASLVAYAEDSDSDNEH